MTFLKPSTPSSPKVSVVSLARTRDPHAVFPSGCCTSFGPSTVTGDCRSCLFLLKACALWPRLQRFVFQTACVRLCDRYKTCCSRKYKTYGIGIFSDSRTLTLMVVLSFREFSSCKRWSASRLLPPWCSTPSRLYSCFELAG